VNTRRAFDRLGSSLQGEVLRSEAMARHTSFRLGGPADLFVVCDTLKDLNAATAVLLDEDVPYEIIGKGSNLLVADDGYRGAILTLGGEFRRHEVIDECINAGAATTFAFVVQEAYRHALDGLAFGVGIPGTLGGALAMNAGTCGDWIGSIVEAVTLLVPGEGLVRLRGGEIDWGYRSALMLERGIIVEGVLRARSGDAMAIRAEMESKFRRRKRTQPVGTPSAGSVFMNPEGDAAGRLIESAGLKGLRLGGARVSDVHANFIVNGGGAKASDVMGLIRKIQMTVRDLHGIELRTEIKTLGTFEEA